MKVTTYHIESQLLKTKHHKSLFTFNHFPYFIKD